jgi:predicted  nucleic acid-binding Zn-ribbon protein
MSDITNNMSNVRPKLENVTTVSQFFNALASEVQSPKTDLQLRRVRKVKEKKRLNEKGRKQRVRLEKLAMELKATESNLQAVKHEIRELDVEIANTIDTDDD